MAQRPTYPNLPSGSAPAASPWTTLDLSAGSESNTGMKGGGTSLGTSSTLQVASAHGAIDSGLDAYANLTNIGPCPADKRILLVRMTCATPPTEDPGGSSAACSVLAGATGTMVSNKLYASGFVRTYHPGDQNQNMQMVGSSIGGTAWLAGALTCLLTVTFDSTTSTTYGQTHCYGGTSGAEGGGTGVNVTPVGDVYVGVALSQVGAVPASVVTWGGVVVEYQWM